MFHLVAHAVAGTRLFQDWTEAQALWDRLARVPGLRALVLMPNHVHLVSAVADARAFDTARRAFARWRNNWRGQAGAVWQERPTVEALPDALHARRTTRYVHLNPCRARLVTCPAAWPFSTHRDALGLSLKPVRKREPDPVAFHAYVSADPSCSVNGTPYPGNRMQTERVPVERLAGAVSELARMPLEQVRARGPERALWISAARSLTSWSGAEIARAVGVHRSQVTRCAPLPAATVAALERALADERFPGLVAGDLRLRHR